MDGASFAGDMTGDQMMARILRVQDRKGRGPWRPGLSDRWTDPLRTGGLPPIYDEVPAFVALVNNAAREGLHIGCATREPLLRKWFTRDELLRLFDLGFGVVTCDGCEILIETPHQLVIGSRRPLRDLMPAILIPDFTR